MSVVERGKDAADKVTSSRPVRAWQHYVQSRGNVLAAGIAYFAVFSLFPALVIGFTVFGFLLGGNQALQDQVVTSIDDVLPGVLGPDGLVTVEQLQRTDVLSVTGSLGLLLLLYTGLGWLDAMRQGVRAMFDQPFLDDNIVKKKLRDLLVLASLGLAVLVSVVVSLVVNASADFVLSLLGLATSALGALLLTGLGLLVVLAADTVIFLLLFRVLSGLEMPWRVLLEGALLGAAGLGLLKLLGGQLLGAAGGGNPVLAAAGVVGGLLVWLNLVARLTLLAASFAATDAADAGTLPARPGPPQQDHPSPLGPRDVTAASFGQRSADRVSLAAGATLGVVGVTGVRVAVGAVRALADVVRGAR